MNQRDLLGRLGVVGVVLALVAGCSPSPGTSSQPTGTAIPTTAPPATASPTSARAATPVPTTSAAPSAFRSEAPQSGWPYTSSSGITDALFGEDGRVVLIETGGQPEQARVVALAPDGTVLDGWPWTPPEAGRASDAARAALGPDGSVYVALRASTDVFPVAYSWTLHHLGRDGREMAGFPVDLPAVPFCDLAVHEGASYLSCGNDDPNTGAATSEMRVVQQDGSTRNGWPVSLAGVPGIVGFGPDGRVYLATWSTVTALASDGTEVAGWPRKISGEGEPGVQIDAQGRVRVTRYGDAQGQCGLPAQTVYTMLRADGSTGPGWPVTVKGWSSKPQLAADGTMVVASATGLVTAYSSRGVVKDGWPVRRVGVSVGCTDGSRPWAAGDGTIVVVGDGRATLLTGDGQMASGWPVTLPYGPASSCGFACTPGPAGPLAPVVGRRAVYIGAYQGDLGHGTDGTNTVQPRVMVVERDGSMPADAQLLIGKVGDALSWLRIAPTGRVWALVSGEDSAVLHLVAEDAAPGS